ncbi:alpha-L-fucosidase [Paenibacillus yanchengensis]|uniref:alpha-L-fucosidase n=1 Tax=Paenibacillus yanchengensis TaxID=2035833 RepID=A0ABW4YHS5_9BACL
MTNKTDVTKAAIPGVVALQEDGRIADWQRLRYGMFIHWGLYSEIGGVWNGEPVTKGYNEQIQMWANISEEDYLDVASKFTADQFDAAEICKLAKDAGMKYIVITTKHHDGFSMFHTATTAYNIVEKTPYGKDPLQLLAEECRNHGLKFGIYFSLVDWHQGHEFDHNNCNPIPESMEPVIEQQLRELLTNYGPIAEVWFDMSAPTMKQSQKIAGLVRELQPEAMINSRIWNNNSDFRTLGDNEIPSVPLEGAWQTPASIYHSTWGYRSWQEREDLEGKTKELVQSLVSIFARGGNYLLNIGPRGDGSIVAFEADVLRGIGSWIQRHASFAGDLSATYFDQHTWGEVLADEGNLYLCVNNWPEDGKLVLSGLANKVTKVVEDGETTVLSYTTEGDQLIIELPKQAKDEILPVIRVSIEGALRVIPKNTVSEIDGVWKVDGTYLYTGNGYADEGHYFTLKQTQVRLTSYLAVKESGNISIHLNVEADPNRKYKVAVGNQGQVLLGAELSTVEIGPFAVPANQIIPLTITLADSAYVGDDLRIDFSAATVTRK